MSPHTLYLLLINSLTTPSGSSLFYTSSLFNSFIESKMEATFSPVANSPLDKETKVWLITSSTFIRWDETGVIIRGVDIGILTTLLDINAMDHEI